VIAIRVSAGATAPAEIIVPAVLATAVSTVVGITAARLLQRLAPPQDPGGTTSGEQGGEGEGSGTEGEGSAASREAGDE
jgi:hypothetical protein